MSELPTLAVIFGLGSLSPTEIARSCEGLCEPLFVVPRDASIAPDLEMVLGACGDVVADDLDVIRGHSPAGIVTFADALIEKTARLAYELGLPYHSPATARALCDKSAQRERLAAVSPLQFQVVKQHTDIEQALIEVGLPAVLKPTRGTGGRNTYLLEELSSARELVAQVLRDESTAMLVEQLLQGDPGAAGPYWSDVVSVETLVVGRRNHHLAITARLPFAPPFRESGAFLPALLCEGEQSRVEALVDAAIDVLEVGDGFLHTEVKLTPDGPRIVEVNGRLGGFIAGLLERSRGWDAGRFAARAALGLDFEPPTAGGHQVAWVRLLLPPVDARRITRVEGLRELRTTAGVEGVNVWSRGGDDVSWRSGFGGCLGTIIGRVASHADLPHILTRVDDLLHLEYE